MSAGIASLALGPILANTKPACMRRSEFLSSKMSMRAGTTTGPNLLRSSVMDSIILESLSPSLAIRASIWAFILGSIVGGGFIFRSKGIEINQTFASLVKNTREHTIIEVANKLFKLDQE